MKSYLGKATEHNPLTRNTSLHLLRYQAVHLWTQNPLKSGCSPLNINNFQRNIVQGVQIIQSNPKSVPSYILNGSKPKPKLTRAEADLMPASSSGPVASKVIKSNQEGISKPSSMCFYLRWELFTLTMPLSLSPMSQCHSSLRNGHNVINPIQATTQWDIHYTGCFF